MANGDEAAADGMEVVPGTADRRQGYDEINKTRDYIARRTLRQARGQRTLPRIEGNAALNGVQITFPADTFTTPPLVLFGSSNGRLNPSRTNVTTTGFVLSVTNTSNGAAPAGQVIDWYAVEA